MSGHGHGHGPANRGRRVLETTAPLFVCEPTRPTGGGGLVLHDVLGLTDDMEESCRDLAATGRLTVAPYLYYEHGGPAFPADQLPLARKELGRLTMDGVAADVRGALDYLAGRGAVDVMVVGYGVGGYIANLIGTTLIPPAITARGLVILSYRSTWRY